MLSSLRKKPEPAPPVVEQPKPPHPFKLDEGHVVTKAFIKDGIQHYQLHDFFNSFCARAMDALHIYEAWQMRFNRDLLLEYVVQQKQWASEIRRMFVAKGGQLDMNAIMEKAKEIEQASLLAEERIMFALPSEEIIWQFMAIAYFDENESPYRYDPKYGEDKIKRWKKNHTIEDFFLSVPIRDLVPLPDISAIDLKDLLMVMSEMEKNFLKVLAGQSFSNQQREPLSTGR